MCLPSQFSLLFCFFVLWLCVACCRACAHVTVCVCLRLCFTYCRRKLCLCRCVNNEWVFCMLDANYTLHFHSIGVRDRIVCSCTVLLKFGRSRAVCVANITFDFNAFSTWTAHIDAITLFIPRISKCILFLWSYNQFLQVRVFTSL